VVRGQLEELAVAERMSIVAGVLLYGSVCPEPAAGGYV
jgi:hypothetical protein